MITCFMKTPFFCFFSCLLLLRICLSAEEVKIVKVHDSNLFELKDGRKIKLANVASPSVHDADPALAALGRFIKKYAEDEFAGEQLIAEFAGSMAEDCQCYPAHLFQKFTLKTVWYNQSYLEKGYGKYTGSPDSLYHQEYFAASEEARKSGSGVWNPARYEPLPRRCALSLLAGAGDRPNFSDDYYREICFSYEPITYKNGFSIVFGVIQTEAVGDPEAPLGYPESEIKTFYLPYLIPQFRAQGDYIGVNGGFFFNLDVFSRDNDPALPPVFMSLGLQAGLLRTFYLSADFFNDFLFGPFAIGLNMKTANPYIHLWLGNAIFNHESGAAGFKLDILIAEKYLLKTQGAYNFDEQEKQYGFRVGMGYVLGSR